MINTCFTQNQKQNFEIVLKFKSDTIVLTCTFCFLFYPPLLLFLTPPPRFFSFLSGNLQGFVLVGKVFEKALNIIGLDRRKCRRVVDQDLWEFLDDFTCFQPFSPASLTESYSFWHGLKDFFPLHKLHDKVVLEHGDTTRGTRDLDLLQLLQGPKKATAQLFLLARCSLCALAHKKIQQAGLITVSPSGKLRQNPLAPIAKSRAIGHNVLCMLSYGCFRGTGLGVTGLSKCFKLQADNEQQAALELTPEAQVLEGRDILGHFGIQGLRNPICRGFQEVFYHFGHHVDLSEYTQDWEQCRQNIPGISRHGTVWMFHRSKPV